MGAFVDGGFIVTLNHRHDIRVAIASGMFLKQVLPHSRGAMPITLRLEIFFFLAPCYWKWSTGLLLSPIVFKCYSRWSTADSVARADIWQMAWSAMTEEMDHMQVICRESDSVLSLVTRDEATKLKRSLGSGLSRYHPYMNPSSRRSGSDDFHLLLEDLRSRRLCRACESLAQLFKGATVSYTDAIKALEDSGVKCFGGVSYQRTRFIRWLFKAEGVTSCIQESCWDALSSMGAGVKSALDVVGIAV